MFRDTRSEQGQRRLRRKLGPEEGSGSIKGFYWEPQIGNPKNIVGI